MSSHRHQLDSSPSQPPRSSHSVEGRRRGGRHKETDRDKSKEGRIESDWSRDDERKWDLARDGQRDREKDRNHDRERVQERDRLRRDDNRKNGSHSESDPRAIRSNPIIMSIKGRSKVPQPPSRPTSSISSTSISSLPTRPPMTTRPSNIRPPTRPPSGRPLKRTLENYVPEEETIRNDYALRYAVGGEWSGNWIKGANAGGNDVGEVCSEYPRLRRLLDLKRNILDEYTHPPLYLNFLPFSPSFTMPNSPMIPRSPSIPSPSEMKTTLSPLATPFSSLPANPTLPPNPTQFSPLPALVPSPYMQLTTLLQPHRFTSILINPPPHASWNHIQSLPIRLISADQSFVFLWVGRADNDGLERGRELLLKWGFRRCEDIVWVKTNRKKGTEGLGNGMMVPMKEHCLVGIRGTVRRSTDPWLIHANVDTDVIVWDGPDENDPNPPTHPPQLYDVIENFCLGTRRLELFSPRGRVRKGWVGVGYEDLNVALSPRLTVTPDIAVVDQLEAQAEGMDISDSNEDKAEDFDSERYGMYLSRLRDGLGRYVLPHSDDIEALRPKTPPRSGDRPTSGVGYASPAGELHQRPAYDQQQRGGGYALTNNYGSNMQGMNMMNNPMMNPFMMNMMTLQQQINHNMALAQMQMMGAGNGMGMNDMMSMMGGAGGGMPFGMMGMNPTTMMMGGMGNGSGQRQQGGRYEPYDVSQRWQGSGEQAPWSPPYGS